MQKYTLTTMFLTKIFYSYTNIGGQNYKINVVCGRSTIKFKKFQEEVILSKAKRLTQYMPLLRSFNAVF